MKLEFIPNDASDDTPLVRLYAFDVVEASNLRNAFADLATESTVSLELHNVDFIDAINDCRLTLMVHRWDQGLMKIGEPATFRCALSAGTWDNIEGLTEPFTQPGDHGFQWLNDTDTPLLLSSDGRW